jgi:hypothetical protein
MPPARGRNDDDAVKDEMAGADGGGAPEVAGEGGRGALG